MTMPSFIPHMVPTWWLCFTTVAACLIGVVTGVLLERRKIEAEEQARLDQRPMPPDAGAARRDVQRMRARLADRPTPTSHRR